MTRNGKIARLPRVVREELNCRLQNGEPAAPLLAWLNARKDVRAVLTKFFEGRDINEQNLCDWRNGGFEDWLRFQDTRDWVRDLVDRSSDMVEDADQISVADWLSAPLAVALGRCIHRLATDSPDFQQRKDLVALAREIAHLRRSDHKMELVRLERARFAAAQTVAESSLIKANQAQKIFSKLRSSLTNSSLVSNLASLSPSPETPQELG